jgi:phosphocarrier protein
MTIENRHTIINEKGLHARASAKLVETVERFNANAIISKDDISVSGDSIMGLLMLAAAKGQEITIITSGPEEKKLSQALTNLILNRFEEDL